MSAQLSDPEACGTFRDVHLDVDVGTGEAVGKGNRQSQREVTEVIELGGLSGLYATVYSAKCLAVFGETKACIELLKALGGRFNKSLLDPKAGGRACGWVFRIKDKDGVISVDCACWVFPKRSQRAVISSLSEISSEKKDGGGKPAKKKQKLADVRWSWVVDCECGEASCDVCSCGDEM